MTAYAAGRWTDFAVAAAGTAATLAGLVFVAVSINLRQLMLFAMPLVVGIFLLVPDSPVPRWPASSSVPAWSSWPSISGSIPGRCGRSRRRR